MGQKKSHMVDGTNIGLLTKEEYTFIYNHLLMLDMHKLLHPMHAIYIYMYIYMHTHTQTHTHYVLRTMYNPSYTCSFFDMSASVSALPLSY